MYLSFVFVLCSSQTKIPHSKQPPWVKIETDIKVELQNCIEIGKTESRDDNQELSPQFLDLQDTYKQMQKLQNKNKLKNPKRKGDELEGQDDLEDNFDPEYEEIKIEKYSLEQNVIPQTSLFDLQYIFSKKDQKGIKNVYRAYPTMTKQINLAHHNILEQFLMKNKKKVQVACAIDNIEGEKSFANTEFGNTDTEMSEHKKEMILTNYFNDITYVLGEVKKPNREDNLIDVMKNFYFVTQISKKMMDYIGYISGLKNFCEYIIQMSQDPIEIEKFEDITSLEDMFDARLIHYQRKIDQYLEKLKNEKGIFENINYSGLYITRKALSRAKDGQNSPLNNDSIDLKDPHKNPHLIENLDGNEFDKTFKTFGEMDTYELPVEQISDAIEAIKIIQEDFPRYITQIEKDQIIRRKEQAYLKILPLLKQIHTYGKIIEAKTQDEHIDRKLTKKEFRELRQSKQKLFHIMHRIQKRAGKKQKKFLGSLVSDLIHMEKITNERQKRINRNLLKKQRSLLEQKCDPYFFRIHPLIVRNWTPAMIEVDSLFINLPKEKQTPDKIYNHVKFSQLVFIESLNLVDFNQSFSKSPFGKFLSHYTSRHHHKENDKDKVTKENYSVNQHRYYFVIKYFYDFVQALVKEYVFESLDFYDCFQKVKYFSYKNECSFKDIFQNISVEVNFTKISQLKTGNFLEDGELLYKEFQNFLHHLDLQVKEKYEQLLKEQKNVDKEIGVNNDQNEVKEATIQETPDGQNNEVQINNKQTAQNQKRKLDNQLQEQVNDLDNTNQRIQKDVKSQTKKEISVQII